VEGHCRYQIGTESLIQRRLILLDRSDLILAESFDPYFVQQFIVSSNAFMELLTRKFLESVLCQKNLLKRVINNRIKMPDMFIPLAMSAGRRTED